MSRAERPPHKRSFPRRSLSGRSWQAVLALDPSGAEWLDETDPAQPLHGVAPANGERPADLAQAAAAAIERSGGGARPCVLALSDAFVEQRFLHVPRFPRGELREVFRRKAAKLTLADPDDIVFSSLLVDDRGLASDSPDAGLQTWHLAAASRAFLSELLVRLRTLRIPVRLVLGARMATLNRAQVLCEDPERACIAVTVGRSATSVALLAGKRLLTQYRLEGNYLENAALGAGVLQDIRNCASFWRKVSRGADVERVVVTGLSDLQGEPFARSVEEALGGVHVDWRTRNPEHPSAGRIELLACCLAPGPFHADLTVRLAPSGRRVAAVLSATALTALGLAGVVQLRVGDSLERMHRETARLSATAAELVLPADTYESNERMRRAARRLERATSARPSGVPLRVLSTISDAFEGRAELLTLDVSRGLEDEARVSISGRLEAEPVELVRILGELVDELADSPDFRDVVVHPSPEVPERAAPGERRAPVPFSIEALLARDQPSADHAEERR